MAVLVRFRRIPTLTAHSPLIHHRFFSTSNSDADDDANSNNPSIHLRRVAIEQQPSPSNNPSSSSTFSANSERLENKLEQLRARLWNLDHRYAIDTQLLSELKDSTNSFLSEFVKNLSDLSRLLAAHMVRGTIARPRTRGILAEKLKILIARLARLKEITAEGAQLAAVLTNARLDPTVEIIIDFSATVTDWSSLDEEFEEMWSELNLTLLEAQLEAWPEPDGDEPPPRTPEISRVIWLNSLAEVCTESLGYCDEDLMRNYPEIRKHWPCLDEIWGQLEERLEMELKGAKSLAAEADDKLAFLSELIARLSDIRRMFSGRPEN